MKSRFALIILFTTLIILISVFCNDNGYVICPDDTACPNYNICCKTKSEYRCCPSSTQCCYDGNYCCEKDKLSSLTFLSGLQSSETLTIN